MSQNSQYKTSPDTTRSLSQNVWKYGEGCPSNDELQNGPRTGIMIYDDFTNGGVVTSPSTEAALVGIPYSGFGSSGGTITHADATGGALVLTEATDNEGNAIKAESHPFKISSLLGDLYFEARVKVSLVTDDLINMFVGLMDTTALSVNVPLSSANPPVLTGCNFVGFFLKEADAGAITSSYIADGVTPVTVQTGLATLVADTYIKLGMVFQRNYRGLGSARIAWFVNGTEQSTTKIVPNDTGTDFPADVRLSPVFGQHLGGSQSTLSTIDWWKCVQLDVT